MRRLLLRRRTVGYMGLAWRSLTFDECPGRPISGLCSRSFRGLVEGKAGTMKSFRLVGVAMLALFAFGAVLAASASATVTFLLAEWLVGGVAITSELLAESPGSLILKDKGLKASIECTGSFDGWVGPNSLGYTSEVLNANKEAISTSNLEGLALPCTPVESCSGTAPEVWPVNLGWETDVELMEDSGAIYYVSLTSPHADGGQPGWSIVCTVLGIKEEDECTFGEEGSVAELTLSGTSLLVVLSESFTELAGGRLASCSLGGSETGEVTSSKGGAPLEVSGGGELTASSEGATS
jgi:hypothetical protein